MLHRLHVRKPFGDVHIRIGIHVAFQCQKGRLTAIVAVCNRTQLSWLDCTLSPNGCNHLRIVLQASTTLASFGLYHSGTMCQTIDGSILCLSSNCVLRSEFKSTPCHVVQLRYTYQADFFQHAVQVALELTVVGQHSGAGDRNGRCNLRIRFQHLSTTAIAYTFLPSLRPDSI